MRIAVVTGASSGMGKEFVYQIQKKYPKIEEIWVIARREEELQKLPKSPIPLQILPLDLAKEEDQKIYREKLREKKPKICMLIHCAGMGYLGRMDKISAEDQIKEAMINCTGLTAVTLYALPYMFRHQLLRHSQDLVYMLPQKRMRLVSAGRYMRNCTEKRLL